MGIAIDLKDTYQQKCKMYAIGKEGRATTILIPRAVIERKAREEGLLPGEFVKQFHVVAYYNNFDGIFYTFEKQPPH